MNISKFTLNETLKFLPKAVWPKDKEHIKATRAISKLTGSTLINVGNIDIANIEPSEVIGLPDINLPSSDLMILSRCPLEADDVTGEPVSWGNALVRLSIGDEYLDAALAIQPKPNDNFMIVRVMRTNRNGEYSCIFPEEGKDSRIDEIMSFDDMRRMVFGLSNQVLKSKLIPTNPNIIYDKRLRHLSKKEKESYIEYKAMPMDEPVKVVDESESKLLSKEEHAKRLMDLVLDESTSDNRMHPSRLEELNKVGPSTSTKLSIMKRLKVGNDLHTNQSLLSEARDISNSILFVEVHALKAEFDVAQNITYQYLPFRDFMFLCDMEVTDDKGEPKLIKDSLLVRMKRIDEDNVRQFIYYRSNPSEGYVLLSLCDMDVIYGMRKQIIPTKSVPHIDEFLKLAIPIVKHALFTIINFEPMVKNDPTNSFQIKKHVAKPQQDKYLEYTLDMNKSRAKNYGSRKLGGTHASPVEHVRMGHERKYKSGKKVWINDVTVNKGKGGRIEKDYKL